MMTTNQSARISMNYVLLLFLQDNKDVVNSMPLFRKLADELRLNISAITEQVGLVTINQSGMKRLKKQKKALLLKEATRFATILRRYAVKKKLKELEEHLRIHIPKLPRMTALKLLAFARLMVTMLFLHGDALQGTAATLRKRERFREMVNEMATFFSTAMPGKIMRREAGARLTGLLRLNQKLIDRKMHAAVRYYLKKYPAFYQGFMKCARLRSPQSAHTRVQGVIKDRRTGHPIAGVVIRAEGTGCEATSRKTGYRLKISDKGSYTLVFEKKGYKISKRKNVRVRLGETVNVDVLMLAV